MAVFVRGALGVLAAVLLCPTVAHATAPTPYSQQFFDRQVSSRGGTLEARGTVAQRTPVDSQYGGRTRYVSASTAITPSDVRNGALKAVRATGRVIRHPAFTAAAIAAGYYIDEDGTVREEGETVTADPEEYPDADSIPDCNILDTVGSKDGLPDPNSVLPNLCQEDGAVYQMVVSHSHSQNECPSLPYNESGNIFITNLTNKDACAGYFPVLAGLFVGLLSDYEPGDGAGEQELPGDEVDDSVLDDAISRDDWRKILDDIINTEHEEHPWSQDAPEWMDDEGKPIPPGMQDEMENIRDDFQDREEDPDDDSQPGEDSDEQVIDELTEEPVHYPEEPDAEFEERELAPEGWEPQDVNFGDESCPEPLTRTLEFPGGHTAEWEMPWDYVCDWADFVRPVLIAMAWLLGGFIVVRSVS